MITDSLIEKLRDAAMVNITPNIPAVCLDTAIDIVRQQETDTPSESDTPFRNEHDFAVFIADAGSIELKAAFAILDVIRPYLKRVSSTFIGVCSNKPRPSVQNNHSKGSQYWKRDAWHIRASDTSTLCGKDSSEWLNMGEMKPNHDLCRNCAKKAGVTAEIKVQDSK